MPLPSLPTLNATARWPTSLTARQALEEKQRQAKSAYRIIGQPVVTSYACETCNDTGWVDAPLQNGLQNQEHCPNCYNRRQAARLQAICGLNDLERRVKLSDVKVIDPDSGTARMVKAAAVFIASPIGYLTIHGTCGNAKTLTLQAVVNHFVNHNVLAIYTTFADAVAYIKDAFSEGATDSAQARVNRLQTVPVLAIDELDKVKSTDWVREVETQLLDRRYRDGLAGKCGTLIAMNGSLSDLQSHIASRLKDGRNIVIENNDADLRELLKRKP